jgi:hypothetical protein
VSATTFTNDIDNQSPANYKYDKTGNLIEDVSESTRIYWTYYNKVKQIDSVKLTPPKYGLVWATKLRMKYDALGNRVVKENPKRKIKEVYVRDVQGNILALYQVKNDSLYTKEFYMYGSQRLGYLEDEVFLGKKCIGKLCNIAAPTLPLLPSVASNSVSVVFGKKRYEISDWLGNVRVVINDRKTPVNSGVTTVGYKAQVVSVSDYYSFGSEIAERTYDPVKPFYRFGFNTQEKTFELNRDHYTAKFWEYDARLGRRWNVDPKPTVGESEYAVNKNNPVLNNDPDGDCPICPVLAALALQAARGAAVGAAIDAGIQLYDIATDEKKTLEDFSFTSVATSAAIGATGEWAFRLVKPALMPLKQASSKFISTIIGNNIIKTIKYTGYGGDILVRRGQTTTVLGKYFGNIEKLKQSGAFKEKGLNFLDEPELFEKLGPDKFFKEINIPFLEKAIKRGDVIRFVTDPNDISKLTGSFKREVEYLEKVLGKKLEKGTTEIDFSKIKVSDETLKKAAESFKK